MRRTRDRPIPSGRVAPGRALGFGILLSALGFADLAWGANMVAAFWGLVTLLSYLFLYTPLKRRTPHSTTLGALPGAMPPLIGYAAARGALAPGAWVLFAILFFWQFPHFLAIAWMYREDYRRGGIVFLPVVEPDGKSTARQMLAGALLLVPISLLPAYLSMAGRLYGIGALALGAGFVLVTLRLALDRTAVRARSVLLASVVYLPLLYGLLLADSSRLWPS
jgi:protoheme IX farnesyltransferase